MKNATQYQKKVKKLLSGLPEPEEPRQYDDPIELMVHAILEADATAEAADEALERIRKEFVDLNELRVAPHKEIAETLGRDYPRARQKARHLAEVLGRLYERHFRISLDPLAEMTKRELRRHLRELGLDTYAEAVVSLQAFDAHAVPVDRHLVDSLEMDELIHPGSEPDDVQGFLERIISQKNALAAHRFFRGYVAEHEKQLAKLNAERLEREEAARQESLAAAKRAAEKDEAERRAAVEARVAKEAEEKEKARRKGRKKTAGKAADKDRTKKPTKTAKKTGKKSAKSAGKKTRKTSAAKTSRRSTKKTAGKARKKKSGKTAKKSKKAPAKSSKKKTSKRNSKSSGSRGKSGKKRSRKKNS